MTEHDFIRPLATAKSGIQGEEKEHIGKAHHIINQQRPGIVADELGAVIGNQIGKETEKAQRRIISDEFYGFHQAFR